MFFKIFLVLVKGVFSSSLHPHTSSGLSLPVMHYQSKKFKYEEASYVGRVSFGLKDAASGGLNSGDVSLKLLNVTIEDAGDYICLVSSNQGYDRSPVNLIVTASGSPPFLSVAWGEDDKVNVSCESEGWYPQPVLRWSDKKQDVKPQSLVYRNLSSGLFLVHSWLLLSSTSEPSCSVGLSDKEVKEAKVSLGPLCKTLEPGKENFCVIVILCLFVFDCKYSKNGAKSASDTTWILLLHMTEIPNNSSTSFPNTSNGFWFLSSSPKRANSFQFSTQPEISIPFHSRPRTVGVYLDRDSGELSFYNVEEKTLIGSFTATFKGEIFPLFNPGKGDTSAMEVIHREVQSQTGDEGNCAGSVENKTET
uniref:Ig-like domain-containing protein n=1 Tax=Neolamprologus brichardi TaxID=32507 RepID=A0A3Q4HAF9_NEOBR